VVGIGCLSASAFGIGAEVGSSNDGASGIPLSFWMLEGDITLPSGCVVGEFLFSGDSLFFVGELCNNSSLASRICTK